MNNDRLAKERHHYEAMGNALFELLCETDRVCRKNAIRYWLAYGTLIGAVREQNLIPWDDDLDVWVTQQGLEKLIACRDDFSDGFELVLPEDYGENVYQDNVVRLNYTYTRARGDSEESRYYSGLLTPLHLDFFVIAPLPEGFKGKMHCLWLCALYGMANAFRYRNPTGHYRWWMKAANAVLLPLGRLVGCKRLRALIRRATTAYQDRSFSRVHTNNNALQYTMLFFSQSDFADSLLMPVRDRMFPVPVGYDNILTQCYGDYMTPPDDKGKGWTFADPDCFAVFKPEEEQV